MIPPYLDASDGVPVVAFYDPNCGHCRNHYPEFMELVESHGDRAKFYLLPRRLWESSELQIAALHVAARAGRSFDLWAKYFGESFDRQGMTRAQIQTLFTELGLPTVNLAAQLEAEKPSVQAELAVAKAAGIKGPPLPLCWRPPGREFQQLPRLPRHPDRSADHVGDALRVIAPPLHPLRLVDLSRPTFPSLPITPKPAGEPITSGPEMIPPVCLPPSADIEVTSGAFWPTLPWREVFPRKISCAIK